MRPNILVLMCDQLQARAISDAALCDTPNIDRLRRRGVGFLRAYTPNAVCSPARASLMTGKLPHNHNVLWVTHTMPHDQVRIREGLPHFAEDLVAAGYTTSYVGKWHVEPSERPSWYGWQRDRSWRSATMARREPRAHGELDPEITITGEGYRPATLAGVTDVPPGERAMGVITDLAATELDELAKTPDDPWCLFVSVPEPHDPYICGEDAYRGYEGRDLPVPANWQDELGGRPRVYQRAARVFEGLSEADRLTAARCYYASISEIDALFGRLLGELDDRGIAQDTAVVLLTDHGDYLGAHGMYCKNLGAWEEAYNVPLVIAGPGIGPGEQADGATPLVSKARVGTHAVFPSLLRHYGIPTRIDCDAPLFDDVLAASGGRDLAAADERHGDGLAEYHGGRLLLTQRIYYHRDWKLVWNGFDDHEFYNLADDPGELTNLAGADGPALARNGEAGAAYRDVAAAYREVTARMWAEIERTGDATLVNSHYVGLRASEIGPLGST